MGAALILLGFFGVWELYARLGGIDEIILPAPTTIAQALYEDRSLLIDDAAVTAVEIAVGLILALIAGLLIALAMHSSRSLRDAGHPLLIASQAIPIAVIAPLLVFWWGFGLAPKVVVVALVCYFPVVITTLDALGSVDPDLRKLLRTLGASPRQVLRYAELPSALPAALTGAKLAVAIGGIAAVFAEYTGSSEGLGHLILQSNSQLETARSWAAVVVLAAISLTCFYALALAERRLTPWAHRPKDPA